MVHRPLFGGAIVADVPEDFVDVSDFRQVPDNQEVFLNPGSNVCLVIEVLQRIQEPDDEEAVKFHFQALADDNDAVSSTMQLPIVVHNDRADQLFPIILCGTQRVRKSNASVPDDVDILLALFRFQSGGKSADLVVSESIPRDTTGGARDGHAATKFNSLVSSLHVTDYNLFC